MKNDNNFNSPVLVLVCKRPLPGQGKQRLAATLGTEHARQIADALLGCALEDAEAWPGELVIAPARRDDDEWARGLVSRPCTVIGQGSGNLGQRLNQIDRVLRHRGAREVIYIGSDAPMLTTLHYRAAVRQLDQTEVVLSAADDGGVVLMGSAKPWPDLNRLPWSEAHLGDSLRDCCLQAGYRCGYIAPGYDIDVEGDLARLRADLEQDPRPARQRLHRLLQNINQPPVIAPRVIDAS